MHRYWRRLIPIAISGAVLIWLVSRFRIAPGDVLRSISLRELSGLALALAAYGAFGLWVESLSLMRALSGRSTLTSLRAAARIKAASYLAFIVHYSVGMGAQTYLLRRRAGVEIWFAAGVVAMLSGFDLVGLLLAAGTASVFAADPPVAAAVPLTLGSCGLGAVVLLRWSGGPEPLVRFRDWPIFAAIGGCGGRELVEAAALRFALMGSYFAFAAGTVAIFGIPVSLADSVSKMTAVALIAALPIAAAGLGTSQAAFLLLFSSYAPPEKLLACSLAMTLGLITLRVAIGLVFAREYARESIEAQEEMSL